MAHNYSTKLPNIGRYPGNGYYYIICDVCGRKIRRKDAILITDKYNLQNRLLVCKADADKPNHQLRPFKIHERIAPKLTRAEATDNYVVNPNSSRAPSAPQLLVANANYDTGNISLSWQGPTDCGSDPITGYVIYQGTYPTYSLSVYVPNTYSAATFYLDTVSSPTGSYKYSVAAINAFGTGAQSNIARYL